MIVGITQNLFDATTWRLHRLRVLDSSALNSSEKNNLLHAFQLVSDATAWSLLSADVFRLFSHYSSRARAIFTMQLREFRNLLTDKTDTLTTLLAAGVRQLRRHGTQSKSVQGTAITWSRNPTGWEHPSEQGEYRLNCGSVAQLGNRCQLGRAK